MISQKNIYMDVIYRIATWQCPVWSDKIEILSRNSSLHFSIDPSFSFPNTSRNYSIVRGIIYFEIIIFELI